MIKFFIFVLEVNIIKVKGYLECYLKFNDEGYWEGYFKIGLLRSIVDFMVSEFLYGQLFKLLLYQVMNFLCYVRIKEILKLFDDY